MERLWLFVSPKALRKTYPRFLVADPIPGEVVRAFFSGFEPGRSLRSFWAAAPAGLLWCMVEIDLWKGAGWPLGISVVVGLAVALVLVLSIGVLLGRIRGTRARRPISVLLTDHRMMAIETRWPGVPVLTAKQPIRSVVSAALADGPGHRLVMGGILRVTFHGHDGVLADLEIPKVPRAKAKMLLARAGVPVLEGPDPA